MKKNQATPKKLVLLKETVSVSAADGTDLDTGTSCYHVSHGATCAN